MSGDEKPPDQQKRAETAAQKTPARPANARPLPTGALPSRATGDFGDERPRQSRTHPGGKPLAAAAAGARGKPGSPRRGPPPAQPGSLPVMTQHQKQQLSSGFQDTAHINHLRSVVGATTGERSMGESPASKAPAASFDGRAPAPELTGRDLFKTVQAPVQSREGRRSGPLLQQVLNQFAVEHNPRYAPDGPGKGRGHIFVWDVSRAMSCEVPHFIGMKELNLAQTVDWIRHEAPSRGWQRASARDAVLAAGEGALVLALPKEVRVKFVAVVLPMAADGDGRPRVCGSGAMTGANLSVSEAFGVYAAEYIVHG
ncbi:MAG: hypothetical protein IPJ65_06800 [Archangiaceae bacterium]|nr:hypothetical protein [Archangiaceae bacterium]